MTTDTAPTHNVRPELHELLVPIDTLSHFPGNARIHADAELEASLQYHGQYRPIVVWTTGRKVIAGNGTYAAIKRLGWTHLAVTWLDCDEVRASKINAIDNALNDLASNDPALLLAQLEALPDLQGTGYPDGYLADLERIIRETLAGNLPPRLAGPSLADRFLVPPFDVLDARSGRWRDRKREWLSLGIRSEEGRGHDLLYDSVNYAASSEVAQRISEIGGTSVFDPVLCELVYRWWTTPGARVLDPFAGGSVRGVVAGMLGRAYRGIDLSAHQVEANREQAAKLVGAGYLADSDERPLPAWVQGDSLVEVPAQQADSYDLVFTCPPYYDLERYGDEPGELSAMSTSDFDNAYTVILHAAAAALRPDRFAVIVVGDVRDKAGNLRDLRGVTVRAMQAAGLAFHCGAVLVTPIGTAGIRTSTHFPTNRALGRTHQDVLVFCKGDRRRAAEWCGDVDLTDLPELAEAFDGDAAHDAEE